MNNPNTCGCFAICPNCDPLVNRKPAANSTIPAKCRELIIELMDNGWSFVLQHGKDTGDSPFISIEAKKTKDGKTIRATWHTRQTGTYRLFSCMVNKRDVTLTKAMDVVREEAAA